MRYFYMCHKQFLIYSVFSIFFRIGGSTRDGILVFDTSSYEHYPLEKSYVVSPPLSNLLYPGNAMNMILTIWRFWVQNYAYCSSGLY